MNRPKLNFVIDAVMFLLLAAIAGIGLLMKFVLIPGRERWVKYGRQVDLYLFGWDRHDWGDLHFYLALVLAAVLTLHIILHWSQIVVLFHRLVTAPRARTVVFWVFLALALLLLFFPFLFSPEVREGGRGWRWQSSSPPLAATASARKNRRNRPIAHRAAAVPGLPPGWSPPQSGRVCG
ncbi:MAG: DUF4405 domain-containing protein [Deltaproteobacteria bacterium]|nr:DUF4405 domain-containing protein [Deltaproteobacteria bacterium]